MPFQMLTLLTVLELSKAGTQVLVSSLKSSFGPDCVAEILFGKLEEQFKGEKSGDLTGWGSKT